MNSIGRLFALQELYALSVAIMSYHLGIRSFSRILKSD